jgi:hypothetical protein
MSGLLRRIRLRRAADLAPTDEVAALPPAGDDHVAAHDPLPAGAEPDLLGERPKVKRKGRARRRLRQVRRVREIYLRDLGGFVFELHRTGGGQDERHAAVMGAKLERLAALDAERRELQERLGDPTGELLLREPGIGGTCPTCGELHGSESRFCANCGMPLVAGAARPMPGLTSAEHPALPASGTDAMAGVRAHVAAAQAAAPLAAGVARTEAEAHAHVDATAEEEPAAEDPTADDAVPVADAAAGAAEDAPTEVAGTEPATAEEGATASQDWLPEEDTTR